MRRRDLLAGAAGCGALFPFLRRAGAQPGPREPRLVLLMQTNGTSQSTFWPTATLAPTPILEPLLGDPRLRARTTVIKGLCNDAGGIGTAHDYGFAGLWTGRKNTGTVDDPWADGISIDQLLRQRLTFTEPYPSLNCGVLATDVPPYKKHRTSFSYLGSRRPVPTETDPYKLYARFFPLAGQPDAREPAVRAELLAQRRSVLDHVAAELRALRPRLPRAEREKLEVHESALRAFEGRLGATLLPGQAPRCATPAPPRLGLDPTREILVPTLMRLMFDFVALALSCGITRVVTFPMGNGAERWYFRWLGLDENSHDQIAHLDFADHPDITAKLVKINRWYCEQVVYLARALDGIPEGDGTVLDHSLVVWGNEIATGPHTMQDIPVVLVGGASGRLRRPGVLVDRGKQTYHRLGASVLGLMGVPAEGFGEEPACGPIAGLEA